MLILNDSQNFSDVYPHLRTSALLFICGSERLAYHILLTQAQLPHANAFYFLLCSKILHEQVSHPLDALVAIF